MKSLRDVFLRELFLPGLVLSPEIKERRMKPFKFILLSVILVAVLGACGSPAQATPFALKFDNPYAAQPGDTDLMAGEIKVDSASVFVGESQPPQLMVQINYFPPTPCYQLRVEASGPNAQNEIDLKAYGVAEKDKPCTLMALSTPQQASLNLGNLPKGHYTIVLNGDQIGEIDI
jgi:hypothetical protein